MNTKGNPSGLTFVSFVSFVSFVFFMLMTALTAGLSGHELGTTQVVATFRSDGTYQIDISVDPDALLTKLELASGAALTEVVAAAERDRRIAQLDDVFLDGLDIRFDGTRDRPRFDYRPAPDANEEAPGVVRLSGRMPAEVRECSLSYRFAMGWYALEVHADGQPVRTMWLEGGKPGDAVSLDRQTVRPRVLPRILPFFVLGLVLLTATKHRLTQPGTVPRAMR